MEYGLWALAIHAPENQRVFEDSVNPATQCLGSVTEFPSGILMETK